MNRVVLDECLPKQLRKHLPGHRVLTVQELGFAGFRNGKLLNAISGKCDAFITVDSNISYQQNLPVLPFASIILKARSNQLKDLSPHAAAILAALDFAKPGSIHRIPSRGSSQG